MDVNKVLNFQLIYKKRNCQICIFVEDFLKWAVRLNDIGKYLTLKEFLLPYFETIFFGM